MTKRTRTSHGVAFEEHVDLDTFERGTEPPFESWEGDHTALVHVLWAAENDGLIARRPSPDRPLRRALFDRLFGADQIAEASSDLLADLRAILDEHDPVVTPGAPGSARVEVPLDQRGDDAIDTLASMVCRSRWHAASHDQAVARARSSWIDQSSEGAE